MNGTNSSICWKKTLLHGYADDCIWHYIIPTALTSRMRHWKDVQPLINNSDEIIVNAQKANMHCSLCDVFLEGKKYIFAIRVLISRRYTTDFYKPEKEYWVYRIAFMSICVCITCAIKREWPCLSVDSNSHMHNFILDRLENITSFMLMQDKPLNGDEMWGLIKTEFEKNYTQFMKHLGKSDNTCSKCKTDNPKNRCSACHFARYCNEKCSLADWPLHKTECKILRETSIFCYDPCLNVDASYL
jgi:hypothetical protein